MAVDLVVEAGPPFAAQASDVAAAAVLDAAEEFAAADVVVHVDQSVLFVGWR